jgi:hypothetical protein
MHRGETILLSMRMQAGTPAVHFTARRRKHLEAIGSQRSSLELSRRLLQPLQHVFHDAGHITE